MGNSAPDSTDRALLADLVLRGSENLTIGMTRKGIEAQMTVSDGSLAPVYGTKLTGDDACRVDWAHKEGLEWGRIRTVCVMNRAFR